MKFCRISPVLILAAAGQVHGLVNADFEQQAGAWGDGDGPPGWELRLNDDNQSGVVEPIDFAVAGNHAFYFSHLHAGFGGSRLDQCVALEDFPAIMLSTWAMTDEPHPELSARLRLDFFADESCSEDSANAAAEQVQSDFGLSSERAPAGQWVRLESELRLRAQLGEDVRSVQVSLRVRDRSDGGQPRDPARIVWLDAVSLQADITLLPEAQRNALRDLYQATGGADWNWQLNWMGAEGTECDWAGVTCDASGETVLRLDLARNGLAGTLPQSITGLVDLTTGDGLDLCDNELLIPAGVADFVDQRQIGGALAACQGTNPVATSSRMGGHFFQAEGRSGEGMMVHMLSEGSALFYWATHDDYGKPLWMIATGRARDRVIHFPDLYRTGMGPDGMMAERVGRSRLTFPQAEPACVRADMRFNVQGEGFGASDRRELVYIDGHGGCHRPSQQDPLFVELEGQWFDPAQLGQGISLAPYSDDRVVLTWYGYRDDGTQTWRWGVGERAGNDIEFGELTEFLGGNFNDHISPEMLEPVPTGTARIVLQSGPDAASQWQFIHEGQDETTTTLVLNRIEAGPQLMASTGHKLFLEMDPDDADELYDRSIFSDDRLPGQVRFGIDDQPSPVMGLRFRGSSSRQLPKKSFNIRFEQPQDLLYGSERMNLNAMYTDPAMMREALSFELFHALGQPAPRTRYFDFWLNGIYEGTHIHIQRVDEWLLGMNGLNPDGTLVRDKFRGNSELADSVFGHDFDQLDAAAREDLIADNFDFRGDPVWARLRELVDWVQATPPGVQFAQQFAQRIDVENFIDWLVLHWLIGDIDSFADDYWLYLDHDNPEARWKFIPWDKDLSFGSHYRPGFFTDNDFFAYEYSLTGGWNNLLINRFLQTASLRQQAEQRLQQLMSEYFTQDWFSGRIDAIAERIEDSVSIRPSESAFHRHYQNHHGEPGRYAEHVENLKDFVTLRYRFIERQLSGPPGNPDQAEATIEAASMARVILADGIGFTHAIIDPQLAPASDTGVSIAVDMAPGIEGIDREWTLVVDNDLGTADLTLFYRNDVSAWGRENWWTGGAEAIGNQDSLVMTVAYPDGQTETLPTRVNPYSNKAVAELELTAGEYRLWLQLPAGTTE